jgi:hypothetical protein
MTKVTAVASENILSVQPGPVFRESAQQFASDRQQKDSKSLMIFVG